jgi:glucosamine-6-phosphate deaminase
MNVQLFNHVNIDKNNTHVPCGVAHDMEKECERYTALLQENPQDIQLLGLGSDGHIGFNEPGSPFEGHTHVVELEESTIRDNARLFARIEDVPRRAITMGIADVMQAKSILLLANGANNAAAVKAMIQGEVDENCPASILQRHNNVTVIIDKEAAKLL